MKLLKNWLPALLMMALIFGFSSIPSREMPSFGGLDFSIKKFGHALGYGMLAVSYLRGLNSAKHEGHKDHEGKPLPLFVFNNSVFFAWLMAVLFSATDEFHQSFVPGRNPSLWDVFLFDNFGAIAGLWLHQICAKRIRP